MTISYATEAMKMTGFGFFTHAYHIDEGHKDLLLMAITMGSLPNYVAKVVKGSFKFDNMVKIMAEFDAR